MTEHTETNIDGEGEGNESPVINDLRKQLREAKASAKAATEQNDSFRSDRTQARRDAVTQAVNGLNYPKTLVDSLMVQVEELSPDEFEAILTDLTPVEGEGTANDGTKEQVAPDPATLPNPATLGQQVASAAVGQQGEVDFAQKIAEAKGPAEVAAIVAEAGLDRF